MEGNEEKEVGHKEAQEHTVVFRIYTCWTKLPMVLYLTLDIWFAEVSLMATRCPHHHHSTSVFDSWYEELIFCLDFTRYGVTDYGQTAYFWSPLSSRF